MNRKELLYISVGIFLTVVAWLAADLFHASSRNRTAENNSAPVLIEYRIEPELLRLIESKKER